MANISSQLSNLAIIRSLLLVRISNGLSTDVAKAYQNIIDSLAADLRGATPLNLRNMNVTIAELKSRFEVDIDFLNKDLQDLAVTESAFALNSVNATVGVDIFSKVPPESTIRNLLATSLISDGKRAKSIEAWFNDIDTKMLNDIEAVVKNGVIQGQVNSEIASQLSGVMGTSRHHAETITRTATSMVSNQAREAVYSANEDVIKGYEFMATIDGKTSFGCSTRDGALYDTNRKGLNAKGKQFPYQAVPRHFNCRSLYSPTLKSWKELGIDMDEISAGTRSSMDGQISAETNFDKWFESKDKKFKEKYLGAGRYQLYKDGKITFKDLVNQQGETLTVAELTALSKTPIKKVVKPIFDTSKISETSVEKAMLERWTNKSVGIRRAYGTVMPNKELMKEFNTIFEKDGDYSGVIHRGLDFKNSKTNYNKLSSIKVGEIIESDVAPSSWSRSLDQSKKFAESDYGIVFTMKKYKTKGI